MRINTKLILILLFVVSLHSVGASAAEDRPLLKAPFYNSALYGTVAGLVIGLAVGRGSITTFRITSLGFYGGIILGLYLNFGQSGDLSSHQEPQAGLSSQDPSPVYVVTFHY